jgi:FKBP-type peptidyl-prolyl cis-trans isomerase FklB
MQNLSRITLILFAAASVLPHAIAQQTQTPPPAKTQPTTPAKPAQGTAANPARKPVAKSQPLTLKTPKDKNSYAMGMTIGTGLRKQAIDIDPAILARGLKDSFTNGKTLLTEEEERTILTQLQTEVRKKQQELAQVAGEANKKQGLAFLEANKTKEGVVALPSGLQYKVLQEGTGPKPAATDTVVCNYRGTLVDNTEFDSSYKRGQPTTFPVSGVIKGWTEALQLMPVGSKWQIFVPAELAYGERGAPAGQIGPNSTLIFEVELLSIQEKPANPQNSAKPTP